MEIATCMHIHIQLYSHYSHIYIHSYVTHFSVNSRSGTIFNRSEGHAEVPSSLILVSKTKSIVIKFKAFINSLSPLSPSAWQT